MGRNYRRLLTAVFAGSMLAPLVTIVSSRYILAGMFRWAATPDYLLFLIEVAAASWGFHWLVRRAEPAFERLSAAQAGFLRAFPGRYVPVGIAGAAALSLLLELSMVRWQATVFPFFAFYKNFSVLACFAGLGLGYASSREDRIPLFLVPPLFCWQFMLMLGMRYRLPKELFTSLYLLPFREQLNMGLGQNANFYQGLQIYFVLAVVFVLTALPFIAIGQVCGAVMERREKLSAYGYNLLGSLAGVLLMFVVSAYWTPPSVWFVLGLGGLLLFCAPDRATYLWAAGGVVLALILLEWPAKPAWQRIYSPYQLLEVGRDSRGLLSIQAAGHYYQHVYDFSLPAGEERDADVARARSYYDLPYQLGQKPASVAVVGAGTGNDVAAALRAGAASVDAIEIDPAIILLGKGGHPEHPYADARVRVVNDDARSFLRKGGRQYDLIVFGLLDSHTLLSQASSVRLDSFVYTVEALREARKRLTPQGRISLAFSMLNNQLGRKIFLMMQKAFDGEAPLCIRAGYDKGVVFLESNDREHPMIADAGLLARTGFEDRTEFYSNEALAADLPTDDWPFFYMPRRVYPSSYLVMVALVLVLSLGLIASFAGMRAEASHLPFFLLGAGFMLIETKGITELGLTFGNTWQVIGVVIAGIMVMAFLANLTVQKLQIEKPPVPYLCLLATLLGGWWIARSGGFPSTVTGRVETVIVLTCPIFFSGIVFSTLLRMRRDISSAMGANLFGAVCGGLMEYNSMYFGFGFLYLLAAAIYAVGLIWEIGRRSGARVAVREMAAR